MWVEVELNEVRNIEMGVKWVALCFVACATHMWNCASILLIVVMKFNLKNPWLKTIQNKRCRCFCAIKLLFYLSCQNRSKLVLDAIVRSRSNNKVAANVPDLTEKMPFINKGSGRFCLSFSWRPLVFTPITIHSLVLQSFLYLIVIMICVIWEEPNCL